MRYVLAFLAVLVAQPAFAQNVTFNARVNTNDHKDGVGLQVPRYAGACAAVARQKEGDLCFDTTLDVLYVYDGSAFQAVSRLAGSTSALNADRAVKIKRVALAAVDTAGGVAAWTPAVRVLLHHVILDVTTKSTAASTIDCGIAANATTLNDTLIDGADAGTAAALYDSSDGTDNGTNGVAKTRAVGATESVTCSVASGASAGIAGYLYVFYSQI